MQPYIPLILALALVIGIYVVIVVIFRQKAIKTRAMRSLYLPDDDSLQQNKGKSGFVVFCEEALKAVGVDVVEARKSMYRELGMAGIQTEAQAAYFFFFRFYIQGFFLLVGAIVMFSSLLNPDFKLMSLGGIFKMLIVLILFGIGFGGHTVLLDKLTIKRKKILTRSFPDAMDLLLVCVEAGMPLDSALARVCKEMKVAHAELTKELDRTRLELGLYGDRQQTLQNFAERNDIKSFRSFASSLIQTEKYGTNLADTLRVLADDMRTERLLNAENKAARVPALITVPVIALILFPFLALIMAPPAIRLVQSGAWQ